ncbi:MAG: 3-phenylpropionate/trans-cinnamate dioxygenase ferredoxin component [Acidimicrobiaceae bacterium]|jgi:nitrite reductase/ring-hydroxylating ferredoxin subunit|nr:3-phenylpropionate/trans-cinnamate dioxygenase ferredoxin component [Acidimicrobiaceae bacterium]
MARCRIACTGDVPAGGLARVEVDGQALCLAHVVGGGFHAIEDRCTHEDVELSEGELLGEEVECPMHGSLFNVITGDVCGLPAEIPVKVYDVDVVGDELFVDL